MRNKHSDDYQCYLKFDGVKDFWDEWIDKTLSSAKSKGFPCPTQATLNHPVMLNVQYPQIKWRGESMKTMTRHINF